MQDVYSTQTKGLGATAFRALYRHHLTGQTWNAAGSAWEAWQDGHYSQYLVAAPEEGTAGRYVATRPAGIGNAPVDVEFWQKVDGTLANDTKVAVGTEVFSYDPNSLPNVNTQDVGGTGPASLAAQVDANVVQIAGNGLIDSLSLTSAFEAIIALIAGKTSYVDNGNGTVTITALKQDGNTPKFRITLNKLTGQRTATQVLP